MHSNGTKKLNIYLLIILKYILYYTHIVSILVINYFINYCLFQQIGTSPKKSNRFKKRLYTKIGYSVNIIFLLVLI